MRFRGGGERPAAFPSTVHTNAFCISELQSVPMLQVAAGDRGNFGRGGLCCSGDAGLMTRAIIGVNGGTFVT